MLNHLVHWETIKTYSANWVIAISYFTRHFFTQASSNLVTWKTWNYLHLKALNWAFCTTFKYILHGCRFGVRENFMHVHPFVPSSGPWKVFTPLIIWIFELLGWWQPPKKWHTRTIFNSLALTDESFSLNSHWRHLFTNKYSLFNEHIDHVIFVKLKRNKTDRRSVQVCRDSLCHSARNKKSSSFQSSTRVV